MRERRRPSLAYPNAGLRVFTITRSGGVEILSAGEEVEVTESEVPELPEPGAKGRCTAAEAE